MIYLLNHVEEDIPLLPETEEEKKVIAAKTVSVHFVFGKVNGYFDIRKHKTQENGRRFSVRLRIRILTCWVIIRILLGT